jgi:hypothetical protein
MAQQLDLDTTLLKLYEENEQHFGVTIKIMLMADAAMSFMLNLKTETQILALNSLDQDIFNTYANTYDVELKVARSLDLVKLNAWYDTLIGKQIPLYSYNLLRALVENGLDPSDGGDSSLLKRFLARGPNYHDRYFNLSDWYETLKTFLMYSKTLPDTTFFMKYIEHPSVIQAALEFYENRCKLLELESQTKDELNKQE